MAKVLAWCRRYWWILLVIPALLFLIEKVGSIIGNLLAYDQDPEPPAGDHDHLNDIERKNIEERKRIDAIEARAAELKAGIEQGSPTPSEVFNKETD